MNDNIKGLLFAFTGFACFSVGDAVSKWLRNEDYSAFQISFLYALLGVLFLLLSSKQLGGLKETLRTKQKLLHGFRALLSAPTQAINFFAFGLIPLANAYAVIFLAPFLTTLLGIFFLKERPSYQVWVILFIGFFGVLTTIRPDINGFTLPVLLLFVTATFTAMRNILARKIEPGETALSFGLFPAIAVMIATALPAFLTWQSPDLLAVSGFIIGGITFGAGILLTALAFRYTTAAMAASIHYTQILWAVLFGLLFFADIPDCWTISGSALIIISGLWLVWHKKN